MGDPESWGKWRGLREEVKGHSFENVDGALFPRRPGSPQLQDKRNWGRRGQGWKADPSLGGHSVPVTRTQPAAPNCPLERGHSTILHSLATPLNRHTPTRGHPTVTQGHAAPRTRSPAIVSRHCPAGTRAQSPSYPKTQECPAAAQCGRRSQHTPARGCADTRGHRKRRNRRARTRGPTAGMRPPSRAHPGRSPRRQCRPVTERRGSHAPLEVRTTQTPVDRTPEPQVQPPLLPGLGRARPSPGGPSQLGTPYARQPGRGLPRGGAGAVREQEGRLLLRGAERGRPPGSKFKAPGGGRGALSAPLRSGHFPLAGAPRSPGPGHPAGAAATPAPRAAPPCAPSLAWAPPWTARSGVVRPGPRPPAWGLARGGGGGPAWGCWGLLRGAPPSPPTPRRPRGAPHLGSLAAPRAPAPPPAGVGGDRG